MEGKEIEGVIRISNRQKNICRKGEAYRKECKDRYPGSCVKDN